MTRPLSPSFSIIMFNKSSSILYIPNRVITNFYLNKTMNLEPIGRVNQFQLIIDNSEYLLCPCELWKVLLLSGVGAADTV